GIVLVEGQVDSVALLVTPVGGSQLSSDTVYTASINWGDGSGPLDATAELSDDGTHLLVVGDHVYTEEGSYTISATVYDEVGDLSSGTTSVVVIDAPLEAWGENFTAAAGVSFSGTVAWLDD